MIARKLAPLKRRVPLIAALAISTLAATGWAVRQATSTGRAGEDAPPTRDAPVLDGNRLRFSRGFAERAGLRAEPVSSKDLVPIINVTGMVAYDERNFATIGARISGRVRRVFKIVGDRVRQHEVLAEIESVELGRAQAEVLAARAKEMAAEAQMKRERQLADARIAAERDAELAQAEYEVARIERIAAERTVRALGGGSDGESGILLLTSPIAGRVVSAKASRGKTVEPSDTLYEVADLATVWVELKAFERDLLALRVGDAAEISSQVNPARRFGGQVAHIGDVVDVTTRTASIRVVADNEGDALRPGQSVHAQIYTAARSERVLGVPRASVTRIDGKPTVFVLLDEATVEAREVTTGSEDGRDVAILEGLKEGEKVVVAGMFELKSELFR